MTKITKESLAETMPQTTHVVALFREAFGPSIKVIWAKENEIEVGKKPTGHGVVIHYDPDLPAKNKKR